MKMKGAEFLNNRRMNYATNFTGIRLDFSGKNAVEVFCFPSRMIWNGGTILLNCIYSLFFKFFFLRLQVIQKKWTKKVYYNSKRGR